MFSIGLFPICLVLKISISSSSSTTILIDFYAKITLRKLIKKLLLLYICILYKLSDNINPCIKVIICNAVSIVLL